jgi:cell division septum initiation protein DivIVA
MVEENDTPSFSKELATNQPASLLEMAQRVHDDFVEKGRATAEKLESDAQKKHDELISSAKEFHDISILESESAAAAIVEDAQLSAFTLISDAKIKADSIVSDAHEKTVNLEASILKLQEFEAAYRSNLQALVSGAQATLAVAEIAVEDNELLAPEADEAPASENVNFADALDHAVQFDGDTALVGDVRDVEVVEADSVEVPTETVHPVVVVDSDDDSETDEEEIHESEDDSEEDESERFEPVTVEDFAEFENVEKLENASSNENESPVYYDPLAAKPAIDAATVASILGQSGLDTDSPYEAVSTIINANPGAGWSLDADEDSEDSTNDDDVDPDKGLSDEDVNDSEASHDEDDEDKEEK